MFRMGVNSVENLARDGMTVDDSCAEGEYIPTRVRRSISAWSVAEYWMSQPHCGGFEVLYMDSGEPGCFRCSWRTPVQDWEKLSTEYNRAGKWLDKAHLVDMCRGGVDDVHNIVLLCKPCHKIMPSFPSGWRAWEWVHNGVSVYEGWQLAARQMVADCGTDLSSSRIDSVVTSVLSRMQVEGNGVEVIDRPMQSD